MHSYAHMERSGPELADSRAAAILVHGRDQDEQVMLDVAQRLDLPDVAYVLPVAAARTWYPARYFDPRAGNEPNLTRSLRTIDAALRLAERAGVPDERIVLAGFSQGACLIADYVATAGPRRFAGAAVLTGSLIGTPEQRATPDVAPGLPMVFASSRYDEWIPLPDAVATAGAFRDAGADVTWLELDDRVHHVSDRAVDALRELFAVR
jgi:phospholipase/carboxylesterase